MVTPRSPLSQGGVERIVLETSKALVARDVHVEILCTDLGLRGFGTQRRCGLTIRHERCWPSERDWCLAPGIWRSISARDWDLVHVQSYHTLVAPLAMLRALQQRLPYLLTFHGGGHSAGWRNHLRPLQLRAQRPLLARAARLIATARFELERYPRQLRLPRERFALIPNGVELSVPPSARVDRHPPTLASIGRLERYKGHHRVLAAFPHVLEALPQARLLIVGTGPYEAELRRLAGRLGVQARVAFTSTPAGEARAMQEILAQVSLVVLMSEFETHPLVGLEAAAAGRRLLVSDRGGLSELAEDGLARSVRHGAGPAELGRMIVEELRRPPPVRRPRLTSWGECADRLLELYDEVVGRA